MRCTAHTSAKKNWVQQENKDSEFLSSGVGVGIYIKVYDSDLCMDGFPYVLAPVFSTPAFSTTASYSCFFQVLMHIPPVRSTPASSTPAISTLLSSPVVSTPAFSTPAFSAPPKIGRPISCHLQQHLGPST